MFHRSLAKAQASAVALVALLGALPWMGAACELTVANNPSFPCDPNVTVASEGCPSGKACLSGQCVTVPHACDQNPCPQSMMCDMKTLLCFSPDATVSVVGDDGGPDATTAQGNPDASADGGPCQGFGCRCIKTTDCKGGFACVDKGSVSDVWGALADDAGEAGSGVCLAGCCTSGDCDLPFVCFAAGAGGNYCVPETALGDRTILGTAPGQGSCLTDAGSCRSGLCLDSGVCADTCCSSRLQANECASGTCQFGPFPGGAFDKHESATCGPTPSVNPATNGNPCTMNSDCRSNLCVGEATAGGGTCRDACRTQADCTSSGFQMQTQVCGYMQPAGTTASTELFAACMPQQGGGPRGDGGASAGAACQFTTDCQRGYCASGLCLALCVTDMDCLAPTERCRPQPLTIKNTTYAVLACGE